MTKQKIVFINLVLFVYLFSDLYSQEGIKWKQDDNVNWRDNRISLTLNYANPIITSNESGDGIKHFDNFNSFDLQWEKSLSNNNYIGIKLSYGRFSFTDDFLKLINSDSDKILHTFGIGCLYNFKLINGKTVYLSLRSTAGLDFLSGENRESESRNGYNFPAFGVGISTGPNLGINIINDYDLHLGSELSFNYFGQIIFKPNFYVSISKWIN